MPKKRPPTIAGVRYSKLIAVSLAEPYITPSTGKPRERWLYRCDCGAEFMTTAANVRSWAKHGWASCGACYYARLERDKAPTDQDGG